MMDMVHTFAREGVDDLFLDTLLTLRETLVLNGVSATYSIAENSVDVLFLRPC
jgi:hypothetical protein